METGDNRVSGAGELPAAAAPKRRYESPELLEWGSIIDLTQGPLFGFDDVDIGGSQPL
jgi:hypothetical protein